MSWRENPATVRPMLATLADPPLTGRGLLYEPKYDGIRALVHVPPDGDRDGVRLWSRLGNEKTAQFPSIVRALETIRPDADGPLLVDSRDCRARREGESGGISAPAGTHPSHRRARGRTGRQGAAGRHHRLRSAARWRRRRREVCR